MRHQGTCFIHTFKYPKIKEVVINNSFVDWKIECQLSGCDASIVVNDGICMLQHLRGNSCDSRPDLSETNDQALLFLFCKLSPFCPVTNDISAKYNTSLNNALICFLLTLSWQQRVLSQHVASNTHHWPTPFCCCSDAVTSRLHTNAGNFKFIWPEISDS